MKKLSKIGSNSANKKNSVEVNNGVLTIGENKLEFVSLEAYTGKIVINFGSDEIYKLFEDHIKNDLYVEGRSVPRVDRIVDGFLSYKHNLLSDTSCFEAVPLFEEYMDYCSENNLEQVGFCDFMESIKFLENGTEQYPEDDNKEESYLERRSDAKMKVDRMVGNFLSYKRKRQFKTACSDTISLFQEYMEYCSEHNLDQADFYDFIGNLEFLGIKTGLCPIGFSTFVYCKKGE